MKAACSIKAKTINPLVSVVLAVYNRKRYLANAIESVLNQTYSNIELIVVDDGSTVDLSEILNSFKGYITLITHDKNRGLSEALNSGLNASNGEFVAILSDDDSYFPDKIEKQIFIFNAIPEIDVVYTDFRWLDSDGKLVGFSSKKQSDLLKKRKSDNLYFTLLEGNFIDAISPLVRKKCYTTVGFYDNRLKNLEDWDMWLRMAEAGLTFYYLDEPLVYIRKHKENKSKNCLQDKNERLKILYKIFSKKGQFKSKEWKTIRRQAYANVFWDYAFATFKAKNYREYRKYMLWALLLNPSRTTCKAVRRLIKSWIIA